MKDGVNLEDGDVLLYLALDPHFLHNKESLVRLPHISYEGFTELPVSSGVWFYWMV